jgi:hypothetical protein
MVISPTLDFSRAPRFADARSFWDANRGTLRVVDPRRVGGTEGNKPGFRIFNSDVSSAAKHSAYAAHERHLNDAWRGGRATAEVIAHQ